MKKKRPANKLVKKSVAGFRPKTDSPLLEGVFTRVAAILDEARQQTVRSVNTWMVAAYWLIGREIVEVEQGGKPRAAYGAGILKGLSEKLTTRYGRGFSEPNLRNFRDFFLTYPDREPQIFYTACRELATPADRDAIRYPLGSELPPSRTAEPIPSPTGSEPGLRFHPNLGWSHYRALMRVEKPQARMFYELEAIQANWNKRELERQIGSLYHERLLLSKNKKGMLQQERKSDAPLHPMDVLKDPFVLEFLDLLESLHLSETALETALVSHLQSFLLELGHGFAFIGRQQRLTLDGDHFYADLVFYHVRLKCYVILDLKTQKLTHADLGQMQLYVNYYDREVAGKDDNPTLGLILCTDKNDATVKYVLDKGQEKLFASRYRLEIPSEEQLAAELRRELVHLDAAKKSRPIQEKKQS